MVLGFAQEEQDERAVYALLRDAKLPIDDLTPQHLRHFLVMREGTDIVGVAGVEQIGKSLGLVRSIAVKEEFRAQGIASKLYRAAEEHACSMGFKEVFAMTTTIEEWLTRLGYERVARENVPEEIRQTRQFSGLCPQSVAIMHKTLRVASERLPGTFECA